MVAKMQNLMIAGTSSSCGKNTIALAHICELRSRGFEVVPFKPIAIELFESCAAADVTPSVQLQAFAAGVSPQHDMNPIRVLYPEGPLSSPLLFLNGVPADFRFFAEREAVKKHVISAYERVTEGFTHVVIEGCGALDESIGDSVTTIVIEHLNPQLVLVSDESRGGALAALIGTLSLLPLAWRERVVRIVFNRMLGTTDGEPMRTWSSLLMGVWGIPDVISFPDLPSLAPLSEDNWPVADDGEVRACLNLLYAAYEARSDSAWHHLLS